MCADLHWLTSVMDDPGPGYPPNLLHVFWSRYDGIQPLDCREGQALEFMPRSQATTAATPEIMLRLWDRALNDFSRTACNQGNKP